MERSSQDSHMRVFELAKQLGLPSKDLINDLKTMDVTVANHMAALEENVVTQVQHKFDSGKKDPGKALQRCSQRKSR